MKARLYLLWAVTLALSAGWPLESGGATPPPPLIGTITVRTKPLFAGEEGKHGFYRVANLAAVHTPESLIRDFLLFREGSVYEPALLTETERNLRALDFLISAKVTAGEPHDGFVDVVVETQDAWTTDLNADFSNDGGRSLYDIDITQKDLFGTGAEADFRLATLRERRTRSIELLHPALFGSYWNGDVFYASSSDGGQERVAIERPLYSSRTPYTLSASYDHLRQNSWRYENGGVAAISRLRHSDLALTGGVRPWPAQQRVFRILAGIDFVSDSFDAVQGLPPSDRNFHFFEAGVATNSFQSVKLDHIDFGIREQDFTLGLTSSVLAGWSPPLRGHSNVWRLRSQTSYGIRPTTHTLVLAQLNASTRGGDTNRNAIVSADTRWIARFGSQYPLTFVAHARIDHGWDLDRDVQFFADGQNFLRSYPNYAFTGSHRELINAEQRLFLGREVLDLFEPGVAVFLDSGRAGAGPFRTDAGFGLRLGIARLDSAMLRLDIGYAFDDSPLSRPGMVVSFATTQAF